MIKRMAAAVGVALTLAAGAAAAPCANNNWQPTFVHDLDMEDGPYYVTADGNFLKLRWDQSRGFVPHACELLAGPDPLRDRRGFTSCQEYTRVQCGCSRNIPGNRTCAAFLRWHTAMTPIPGMPPPQQSMMSPPPAAPQAAPLPSPQAAPPPPPQIAPPPVRPVSVSPGSWRQMPQHRGAVSPGPNGLVLQGGPWTNGRLRGGYYDGNHVRSSEAFDFSAGGDGYMRFAVNGGGKYLAIYPRVLEGVSVRHLTTHHSWANSVVIPENTWLFAHLQVAAGGRYTITVSQGNYDDRGGRPVYRNGGRLADPRGRLELKFVDNYAGPAASVVIGEAVVVLAGGGRIAPPMSAAPPAPAGLPPGAACHRASDCASSVCLLGICAP